MIVRTLVATACLVAATATAAQQSAGAARTVERPASVSISQGRLEGVTLPSGIQAFLGIPYAAPPVRELRWRDPQPPAKFTGAFHADRFAPQCVQQQRGIETNQYSGAEVTSEDCLYLNVWAKTGAKRAPVVVFIHGGGFFIGSGSMPLYAGEQVAQRGAVFVNLNYRMGVLGFLASPELSAESPHRTSGNYGFLDQVAALRWVKDNIAKFGGDPDNVTIAGQSAGSMSIIALQASPLTRGLFHRAVGMSGALLGSGPGAMRPLAAAEADGVRFAELLKAKDLRGLRLLPADRLVVPRTPGGPSIGPIQDGYFLPAPISEIFDDRRQNDVPLLLGFTRDESLGGMGPVRNLADLRERAASRFGSRASEFLTLYPATTDQEAVDQARAADRDSTMVAAMAQWATAQTKQGKSKVYSYMFARSHSYAAGVTFPDLDPKTAGAYHTSEVPFWLGTLDSFNRFRTTRAWTPDDRRASLAMTDALVAFARTGKPAIAGSPWPVYDPQRPELLELGNTMRVAPWPDARKLDFFRTVPATRPAPGAIRD